ncbi:hypothetical protein ADU20_10175 [Burkholderia pseudomallei]|nr:hypothetical protein ADU20_10175 [Burkholderia pseudomallei]
MLRAVDASIVEPRVDGPHVPDGDDVRDGESEGRATAAAADERAGARGRPPRLPTAARSRGGGARRAARVLAARPRPRSRAQPASAMSRRCTQRPAAYVR